MAAASKAVGPPGPVGPNPAPPALLPVQHQGKGWNRNRKGVGTVRSAWWGYTVSPTSSCLESLREGDDRNRTCCTIRRRSSTGRALVSKTGRWGFESSRLRHTRAAGPRAADGVGGCERAEYACHMPAALGARLMVGHLALALPAPLRCAGPGDGVRLPSPQLSHQGGGQPC